MAWNDIHTQATDWSNISFQQMFRDAISERFQAGGRADPYPTALAAGHDVSVAAYIADMQSKALSAPGDWARKLAPRYEGTVVGYAIKLTFDQLKIDAGLGVTALGVRHYQRKRPRTITDLLDTFDTNNNTSVAGHKAWIGAELAEFNGTAWVLIDARTNQPDTLDSHGALGSRINPPGECQAGDYIGPWIWNEMRNVLNQVVWTLPSTTWTVKTRHGDTLSPTEADGGMPGINGGADVIASAASYYNAGTGNTEQPTPDPYTGDALGFLVTTFGDTARTYGLTWGPLAGAAVPDWVAHYRRVFYDVTATVPVFGGRQRRVEYFNTRGWQGPVWTQIRHGDFAWTDDDNGDPVGPATNPGVVKLWRTIGPTSAGMVAERFGSHTLPALPAMTDAKLARGYFLEDMPAGGGVDARALFTVAKWDVLGGFVYKA